MDCCDLHEADAVPPCHALFSRQGRRLNESRCNPRRRISPNKRTSPMTQMQHNNHNPIHAALTDPDAVIVGAKLVMRCCCGSDVVPGDLIHSVAIHLNRWTVYYPKWCRGGSLRAFRAWPLAWPSPSGPLGWQRSPGSTARRRRVPRSGMRSTVEAGGASPDNARRSGPRACDLSPGDRRTSRATTSPARAVMHGALRRGAHCGGVRGIGAAGSGPRRCAIALEEAGQAPRHLRRDSPSPFAARRDTPQLRQRFSVQVSRTTANTARACRPGAPKVRP